MSFAKFCRRGFMAWEGGFDNNKKVNDKWPCKCAASVRRFLIYWLFVCVCIWTNMNLLLLINRSWMKADEVLFSQQAVESVPWAAMLLLGFFSSVLYVEAPVAVKRTFTATNSFDSYFSLCKCAALHMYFVQAFRVRDLSSTVKTWKSCRTGA